MIALVEKLVANGVAYVADDKSVYFAIGKFPAYGRLSRLDTREIKSGARVIQDDYSKENAQDFALWKSAREEDEATGAAWDSPWGRGRPGWHLECSAMAMDLLGETLDLHCGGIDLVFPHHEDEIAQSEAATGMIFSRVWCHGAFLLTDGAKMAKRVGNVSTVEGLREARVSSAAIRHFVFNTHYRKELNLSHEALDASRQAVRRVGDFVTRLESDSTRQLGGTAELAHAAKEAVEQAEAALFDDLNAPEAMAALFDFIRRANAELDKRGGDSRSVDAALEAFRRINSVLDIIPDHEEADSDLAAWVAERLDARKAARQRRDFAEADRIRGELSQKNVLIEDGPAGTSWKLV
jgi:cysteinyl-tRNA synthetase